MQNASYNCPVMKKIFLIFLSGMLALAACTEKPDLQSLSRPPVAELQIQRQHQAHIRSRHGIALYELVLGVEDVADTQACGNQAEGFV